MPALPARLIEKPAEDVLSGVLRAVRLSGSLQFCFMPSGAWQTDGKGSLSRLADNPSIAVPFHIVVEGSCWLKMDGRETTLGAGDVVAFPFGTPHKLGAGSEGRLIAPVGDLPPKPWREVPVLRYDDGDGNHRVRLLCGYLQCDAVGFRPLREALPALIHVRTAGSDEAAWLRATLGQMEAEVAQARAGALSMLERLTEIIFIELLRHQITAARPAVAGWLAALADPALGRCLSMIHNNPGREWSVKDLAAASALSRSALAERFEAVLATSPIRYLREWRLCLASIALTTTRRSIAAIAHDAGYSTESAFNRAFSRSYGAPPAAWRQAARSGPGAELHSREKPV